MSDCELRFFQLCLYCTFAVKRFKRFFIFVLHVAWPQESGRSAIVTLKKHKIKLRSISWFWGEFLKVCSLSSLSSSKELMNSRDFRKMFQRSYLTNVCSCRNISNILKKSLKFLHKNRWSIRWFQQIRDKAYGSFTEKSLSCFQRPCL